MKLNSYDQRGTKKTYLPVHLANMNDWEDPQMCSHKTAHWGPDHNHVDCEMFVTLVSVVCCGVIMMYALGFCIV